MKIALLSGNQNTEFTMCEEKFIDYGSVFFYLVNQLFMLSSMSFELEFHDHGMCQQVLYTYFFKGRQVVFFFGARLSHLKCYIVK